MTVPSDGVKKPRGKYWWITLARGVFALALGLGLLLAVLTGLVHIFGGFQSSNNEGYEGRVWTWSSFLLGITEIGLGVLILVSPENPHRAVIWIAAAWATVGGVGLILLSIRQLRLYRDHFSEEK